RARRRGEIVLGAVQEGLPWAVRGSRSGAGAPANGEIGAVRGDAATGRPSQRPAEECAAGRNVNAVVDSADPSIRAPVRVCEGRPSEVDDAVVKLSPGAGADLAP